MTDRRRLNAIAHHFDEGDSRDLTCLEVMGAAM